MSRFTRIFLVTLILLIISFSAWVSYVLWRGPSYEDITQNELYYFFTCAIIDIRTSGKSAEKIIEMADDLYDRGEFDDSRLYYKKAIDLAPEFPLNARAYNGMGSALWKQGHKRLALVQFDEALKLGLEDAYALNRMGIILKVQEKYDEAVEKFDRAVELDPEYLFPYDNRADTLNLAGRYEEALESVMAGLDIERAPLLMGTASDTLYNLGRYDEAIDMADEAIEMFPTGRPSQILEGLYHRKAASLAQLGRYKEAFITIENGLKLMPYSPELYYLLGYIYMDFGEPDKAIKAFVEASERTSHEIHINNQLATCYSILGDYETALSHCDKALEINPNYVMSITTKVEVLSRAGRYGEAGELLEMNEDMGIPSYLRDYQEHALGVYYAGQGQFTEALDHYYEAAYIESTSTEYWHDLGVCYQNLGMTDDAVEVYEYILSSNPNHFLSNWTLGNIYKETGDYNKALQHYNTALYANPGSSRIYEAVAEVYDKLGRDYDAEKAREKAADLSG